MVCAESAPPESAPGRIRTCDPLLRSCPAVNGVLISGFARRGGAVAAQLSGEDFLVPLGEPQRHESPRPGQRFRPPPLCTGLELLRPYWIASIALAAMVKILPAGGHVMLWTTEAAYVGPVGSWGSGVRREEVARALRRE